MTPTGSSLFNQLNSFGTGLISDPSAGLQPIKAAGDAAINSAYGNIPATISKQMATRGYGSSGSMGDTEYQTQLARLNAQSQFNGNIATLASNRQMQGGSLMEQLLGTQIGSSSQSQTETVNPMAAFSALGSMLMMGGFNGAGVTGAETPAMTGAANAGLDSTINALLGGGGSAPLLPAPSFPSYGRN